MTIRFDSDTPIYQQVAEEIEDGILTGAFAEGTQVPSTTEIAVTYQINPATVLTGITQLADGGILFKKRGVGMFVSEGAVQRILHKRRQAFYERYVSVLLEEAEKLQISREEVLKMIQGGNGNEIID